MLRRHPRLVILALAFGVLGAGTAAVLLWSQYHFRAAKRALEGYAFDDAQRHLDLCLKVRPGSTAVRLLAAQTARRRDAYSEAEQHLAACQQLEGMTAAVALERLLLTAQQGDLDGVEGLLKARTGADDADAVLVLEALAKGYSNCYWNVQALVCLNILLERQPQHPQALLMRARLWEDRARNGEAERDNDALRDYGKALELNPTFAARMGLAGALYRLGRPWEAMIEYERLCPLQPANPELLLGLARCRYSLHEVEEARRLLDEVLERHPNHSAALLERGRLALYEGELTEAERYLRPAASLAPRHDCEAQRLFCRCLDAGHKTEEARGCLEDLRAREAEALDVERLTSRSNREPNDVGLRFEIAMKLMRLGREPDAVTALLFVVEQEPRHAPAHLALADYFQRAAQPARAARHRRASVAGAPAR
jgi:tetratricopeptide (TPR) repeat protein